MLDTTLTFRRISYGLAVFLALATLVLSVFSLKISSGNGLFAIVLIISVLCLLLVLFTAYLQVQPVVTIEY
jgi:hypothetical protein